jgi:hypothetical protein
MRDTQRRYVRPAILVRGQEDRTPSPQEWVQVQDLNAPTPMQTLWERFKEACKCECDCTADRRGEPPRCVIN